MDLDRGFAGIVAGQAEALSEYLRDYPGFFQDQDEAMNSLFECLENCRAIHVYGTGRTANAAISLALRLKHFGYNVWFIGDVVKERIKKGDLVILFSGSGETAETVEIAKRSEKDGAEVFGITSYKDSSLARHSKNIFILPGGLEKKRGWEYLESQLVPERETIFYGGGEFETVAYLFQETLINGIGRYKNIPSCVVVREHVRDDLLGDE